MRQSRRKPVRGSSQSGSSNREIARKSGALAEQAVADYLEAKGACILGLNVRVGRRELDILAREGDVVIIVEVRTRGAGSWQSALESIDSRKIQRIREAGERLWSQRFATDLSVNHMRFDAATVEFRPDGEVWINYFEGVL